MSNDFDNDFSWSDDDDNNELPEFEQDDEFDWSDSLDSDDGNSSDSDDDDSFDWLSDTDTGTDSPRESGQLGVTGELSWLQSDSDGDETPSRSGDERTGVTGELSWRESEQRASDFESMLDEAASSQQGSGIDLFAGMDDDDFDDDDHDTEAPVEEQDEDEIPDWLRDVEPEVEEVDLEAAARQSINTDELFADFDSDFDDDDVQPATPTTGELPDWLDDDSETLDETSPEWVKNIKQTMGTGPLEDESVELDEPDWLDEVEPEPEPAPEVQDETLFEPDSLLADEFADEFTDEDDSLFAETPAQPEFAEAQAETPGFDEDFASLFDMPDDEASPEDEEGLSDLLTALEGDDDDDFDLLGELGGDSAADDDLLSLLETSDDDDFDLLDQLEDAPEIDAEAEAETITDDDALETFDFGMDFGADDSLLDVDEDADEDDFLDASWLDDVDIEVENQEVQKVDDVTDFLSSIDDVESGISAPLAPQDADIDFDTLFTDEAFEDMGQDEDFEGEATSNEQDERPEWLQNVTVGDASASAIVRRQQDRPLEDLPDRLQALHEAGVGLGAASAALSASEAIIATDDVASSVSDENEATAVLKISAEDAENANTLRTIAGITPTTLKDKQGIQQRLKTGFNFVAASVAILIFFAVAAPISRGNLQFGAPPAEQFPANSLQANMFIQLQSLSAGDKVLFALEYGPTGAPELDDATSILALHTLSRNAIPVVVSTNPIGLLHGNVVISELALNPTLLAIRGQATADEDFFVSRYITAENIGLRNFSEPANLQTLLSQNIDGDSIATGITSLDDFAYIVVIAESADSVRNWSEQIGTVTDTPLLFATSFASAPLARPYIEANDNSGLIYGLGDFLTYVDQFNASLRGDLILPVTEQATEQATETEVIEATPTVEATMVATEAQTDADMTQTASTPEQVATESAAPTSTATAQVENTDEPTEEATAEPTESVTEETVETATPEPTIPPTPTATATVQQGGLFDLFGVVSSNQPVNVRGGPGTGFAVVGLLQPNERVRILGENADGTWYQVELEGVEEAWIAAFLITLEINPGDSSYLPRPFTLGRSIVNVAQNDNTDTDISTATTAQNEIPEYTIPNGESRWHGITFGLIIIVIIIVVGNLIGIIRDTNQRGK